MIEIFNYEINQDLENTDKFAQCIEEENSFSIINTMKEAEIIWQCKKNYIEYCVLYKNNITLENLLKDNKFSNTLIKLNIYDIITRYIKKNTNGILVFTNNNIFNKLDLLKIYKNLNKNENIFLFTDKYTESWIIKNIYDIYTMREETCAMREETCAMREKTCAMREEDNNYYESIKICPPFKKIINKNFNNIKKLLNLKGIYISEGKIEYIFISYNILFDNSENNISLSKFISSIKKFLCKFGKIIFIDIHFTKEQLFLFEKKKLELEIETNHLTSFVKC